MKNNVVERIVKLIQILEEIIPKGDDVVEGTQEDKYSVHVGKPSKIFEDISKYISPSQDHDHAIRLIPKSNPPNIKP